MLVRSALATCAAGWAVAASGAVGGNARVIGVFSMRARVTVAVNVTGERAGEILARRWVIVGRGCRGDVCRTLELDRQRSDGLYSEVILRRVGPGRYAGSGAFYAGIECRGRVYPHGSRAPYAITLHVARSTRIGGIRFARTLTATYLNRRRSDATPCPLGPSHDAATYTGTVRSGLPSRPIARFSARVAPDEVASFRSTSRPGRGNGRIVSWTWYFGDPGSPYGDTSTRRRPTHAYSAPGRYRVKLHIVDRDGLSATATRTVIVPAPPAASARSSPARARAR